MSRTSATKWAALLALTAAGLHAQSEGWKVATVEIQAALPKLEKSGHLRAIRRLTPFGKPEYQVLEMDGDKTVRQQVIVRYLSSQVQASELPASSVAITTDNYKFHYKGRVQNGDGVAYAFTITPRKKRAGLVKGELWLDGDTGATVRLTGRLVKSPSIFIKRVEITRESSTQAQVTHLSIYTRLFGRAELTIHEQPSNAGLPTPAATYSSHK